jgi:hypothetical protein
MNYYNILFSILPFPKEVIYKIYKMCKGFKIKKTERLLNKYLIKNIKQEKTKFKYHFFYH